MLDRGLAVLERKTTPGESAPFKLTHHSGQAALSLHLLHHFLHLGELLEKAIDFLDLSTRPGRDPSLSGPLDHSGKSPFSRSHRINYGNEPDGIAPGCLLTNRRRQLSGAR